MLKIFTSILFLFFINHPVVSQTADSIVLKEAMVITVEPDFNNIISPNVIAASVETGEWEAPSEGDEVKFNDTLTGTWRKINADQAGWFKGEYLDYSFVYMQLESGKDDIALLEAMGNSMVFVNGTARSGNPYRSKDLFEDWEPRFDYSLLPVKLNKGKNEFLFECSRGMLKVKIHRGKEGLLLNEKDLTLPDIIVNRTVESYGAIPLINATEKSYPDLFIKTWVEGAIPEYFKVSSLKPLSVYKTPFLIKFPARQNTGKIKLNIELVEKINSKLAGEGGSPETDNDEVLASAVIELNVVTERDIHKETFISSMDGSVQYYAVNPPRIDFSNDKPALFLSLHGAGVEAVNQAQAYSSKNWGYIIAPTNRRPYGYNWENWGRMDALEVLDISKKKFNIDEERVYLTGHSMGGHGTWHLGINYPDKFAAIGPSAGWISIWGYRIRPNFITTDVGKTLIRSAKQSDTYAFGTNLKPIGVYIIHGADDDNVRPQQAESMIDTISVYHKNFVYHKEPGVGHWWDKSDEPGADCVDWIPMFDFFAHHSVPRKEQIKMIDFVTANPAISSKNYWIEILNQIEQQKLSRIRITLETSLRKFTGTSDNIETISIDASMFYADDSVAVELDSQLISGIKIPADKKIYLSLKDNKWSLVNEPDKRNKYPGRCGNFREALNHNLVFVYGTHGGEEENKWAFEKARYDAERIWYQGNGSIEIITDSDFDPVKYKDRNVILFGNSQTNSAWSLLLKDSPVQVNRNKITAGKKEFTGDEYACLMIRPRKDSRLASVGVVSGTGIEGMKLANFAQYLHPYMSLPDIVIYNSEIIKSDEQGVKFAGYFGNDWSLEKSEILSGDSMSLQE